MPEKLRWLSCSMRDEVCDKVLKAFGPTPHLTARQAVGLFRRSNDSQLRINKEWIKDDRFFQWAYTTPHNIEIHHMDRVYILEILND